MRWSQLTKAIPRLAYRAPLALVLLATGCVTLGALTLGEKGPAPSGTVCQVVTIWTHQVVHTPDPANGGVSIPGLVGRLYLFGPTLDFPLGGDGGVVIDLYEDSQGKPDKPAVPLEEWRLDKDTLHRLLQRDAIGWGYSLFLPWGTYKPEITRVRLKVRYEPAKGSPLYAEGSPLTLDSGDNADSITTAGFKQARR